jgi:hypothetical protein
VTIAAFASLAEAQERVETLVGSIARLAPSEHLPRERQAEYRQLVRHVVLAMRGKLNTFVRAP